MAKLKNENLFLLEFLVDDLKMDKKCDCMNPGEICVSFQFLDNEALDVCEGDFDNRKFGENNKTGKSCLFSLTPAQAQQVITGFDITVNVFKKMQPGWQPEKTCVGSAKVPILPLFKELISNPEVESTAKVLQDTFPLHDSNAMIVGRIAVYIRLSCYGKMIITQFQMNMDDKSVLFKDKDGRSLYRYKKTKKGRTTKIEDLTQNCPPCPPPEQMYGSPRNFPYFPETPPQMSSSFPSSNPNCPTQACFPPPNLNCPMQPCFPNYGPSAIDMGECPMLMKPSQQVSFGRCSSAKGGCSGGCGRR